MASIGVPLAYRESLTALADLPESDAQRLVDAIAALPKFSSVSEIQAAARQALEDEAGGRADLLIPPLLSLRGQIRNKPGDQLSEVLSLSTDLDLPDDARARLRVRAGAILASPALATTAIAIDLQTQHHRNFQGARIFTDLRPVFQEDVDESPSGAVIVETLQIQTWDRDGDRETLFCALDETDLLELRDVVERALKKVATLKRMLDDQGLPYFELDPATNDS
ncbi:MAG TPA: hypothetical protein VK506_13190 [Conexibacter sp.]|nr:hypothetical protein [Conexibacter sp.]